MTNLSRITAKIFGETATATGDDPEIGQFGSALAGAYVGTNDVATIQSLPAWSNGFIDSVTPSTQFPPLPEMTGFGKVLSYQTAYTMQKGVPEWDSGTTYYAGDFCKGVGEGKLYVSKVDSNINHAVTDGVYWEEFSSGNSRNIGEIITSTIPLTDAGLHLLDGTLISGSGSYSEFVDYIADLYDSGDYTAIFDTEANWQAAVTAYGVCGKFVYDSVNNTVRLPKITGFIEGASGASTLGDLTEAGLPNIEGTTSDVFYFQGTASGCFGLQNKNLFSYKGTVDDRLKTLTFDASRSSAIYGNSSTVQPQSVKVLYYIVVATSTKTAIQVDIDEIATDLNGKADVDLSNINASQSAKNTIVSWATPDYANGITVAASNANEQTYTAPSTGFFNFSLWSQGSTYAYVKVNDVYAIYGDNYSNQSTAYINITGSILVNKNDVIKFKTSKSISTWGNNNYFYPAKGVN